MNKSESIKELAAALAKAQGEIRGAVKDSDNPFFKSKYADLASVVEAIRAAFSKHGLSYIQTTEPSEKNEVRVSTTILHASGEWFDCGILALPVSKPDAQGFGSALTYARRYSLSAAVGVAPEDDDGESAQPRPAQRYTPKPHGVEAAKDLIVAHKNIEAAKAMLGADSHALDERRRALWTRLKDLGMPAGAAADWVKTNRASPPGGDLTVQDFVRMEELVAGIEKGAADKTDILF